jgi:hypothetical protein
MGASTFYKVQSHAQTVGRSPVFMNSAILARQCFSPVVIPKKLQGHAVAFSTAAVKHATRYPTQTRIASPLVKPYGLPRDKKRDRLARKNSGELRIVRSAFNSLEFIDKPERLAVRDIQNIHRILAEDGYNKHNYIRPEQVLFVRALNSNLIPEDFVRTISTGGSPYIRGRHQVFLHKAYIDLPSYTHSTPANI